MAENGLENIEFIIVILNQRVMINGCNLGAICILMSKDIGSIRYS